MDATLRDNVASVQQSLLARLRTGGLSPRARNVFFVGGVPRRTAFENASGYPEPFRDLAVVGAHPVYRNRSETSFLTVAGETQPARAVLRGHRSAASQIGTPVAQHPLLDEMHRVFNGRATFHFAALDRRWMHHPDFPDSSTRVEEGAVAGVLCGLQLQVNSCEVYNLLNAKHKPPTGASGLRVSTFVRHGPRRAPSHPRGSFPPVFSTPTRR